MVRWTQRLTLHLNQGKRRQQHHAILADGKKTGITRHVLLESRDEFDGPYKTLADELHFGTDTYDCTTQTDARRWMRRRLGKKPPK